MERFKYIPEDGFRNATSFPNPANGTEARNQFQTPLDQVRDYLNMVSTKYGNEVAILKIGANKELQFSTDGTNWLSFPVLDFEVVKEVD